MKKLFFAMMILSSYFLLTSCSKSSDSTPASTDVTASISVTANGVNVTNNGTIFLDDSVVVTVTCTGNASNSLTHLKITCTDPNFNFANGPYDTILSGTSAVKSAPRWPAQGSGAVKFTATVTGSTGNPATVTFTVNVVQVMSYQVELGNQTWSAHNQLYSSSVMNSTTSLASFGLTDVALNPALDTAIDFAYFSRTTIDYLGSPDDTGTLAIYGSPANGGMSQWTTKNKTRFIQVLNITSSDFDASLTNSDMLALLNKAKAGGEPKFSSALIVDTQIYLFKTQGGKYGLMEIISPTGGQSYNPSTGINAGGTVQLKIDFFN